MLDEFWNDPIIKTSLAGGVGAFFRSMKRGNSIFKSTCFTIVGVLCAIYLTEPIHEVFTGFNQNGVAFGLGLLGLDLSEFLTNYLSKIKPKE